MTIRRSERSPKAMEVIWRTLPKTEPSKLAPRAWSLEVAAAKERMKMTPLKARGSEVTNPTPTTRQMVGKAERADMSKKYKARHAAQTSRNIGPSFNVGRKETTRFATRIMIKMPVMMTALANQD